MCTRLTMAAVTVATAGGRAKQRTTLASAFTGAGRRGTRDMETGSSASRPMTAMLPSSREELVRIRAIVMLVDAATVALRIHAEYRIHRAECEWVPLYCILLKIISNRFAFLIGDRRLVGDGV